MTYSEFAEKIPVTDYESYLPWIQRQLQGQADALTSKPCSRYQPTSGSSSQIKWIPYPRAFLDELDRAFGPWIVDLYRTYPKIRSGRHYWSLSWIPEHLRKLGHNSDDTTLFPLWKRSLLRFSFALPPTLAQVLSSEATLFASVCYLIAADDLTLISVWSPTFALSILKYIRENRDAIALALRTGDWGEHRSALFAFPCPKRPDAARKLLSFRWGDGEESAWTASLWPRLALISAWDTSTSLPWAKKLQAAFPHAEFQGKGLWATEGVITIPFERKKVLACTSHFFEFRCLDSGKIHPGWELQKGQRVQPLITTGSGFYRYALNDELRVSGFLEEAPCLDFEGRLDGVDFTGEKLSPALAQEILDRIESRFGLKCITLTGILPADSNESPYYALVVESALPRSHSRERTQEIFCWSDATEEALHQIFHYQVARELGQLQSARVAIVPDAIRFWETLSLQKKQIRGNLKPNSLIRMGESDWEQALIEAGGKCGHEVHLELT